MRGEVKLGEEYLVMWGERVIIRDEGSKEFLFLYYIRIQPKGYGKLAKQFSKIR